MKAFLRWLGNIAGSIIVIGLVIMFFPYISQYAKKIMPDESGSAIKASAVLATRLEDSARLETLKINEEGVLNYDIRAAFLGSVANINVSYTYEASFGLDLKKVEIRLSHNAITFVLPQPELIQDCLTPREVYSDEFWYPGFSKADYEELLEKERIACRNVYLSGNQTDLLVQASQDAFEATISTWMKGLNNNLMIHYEQR